MSFIEPLWAVAAAMGLYLNTVNLLQRIKERKPTNGNTFMGCLLSGYIILTLLAVCGR